MAQAAKAHTTSRRNLLAGTAGAVLAVAMTTFPASASMTDPQAAALAAYLPQMEASAEALRLATVAAREADSRLESWLAANQTRDDTYGTRLTAAMVHAELGPAKQAALDLADARTALCYEIADLPAATLEAFVAKAKLAGHEGWHVIADSIVADLIALGGLINPTT